MPIPSTEVLERWRGCISASICSVLLFSVVISVPSVSSQTASNAPPKRAASSDIPHLSKKGTASQLIVDGKPFLALAGELNNDSSSSLDYMKAVWP